MARCHLKSSLPAQNVGDVNKNARERARLAHTAIVVGSSAHMKLQMVSRGVKISSES